MLMIYFSSKKSFDIFAYLMDLVLGTRNKITLHEPRQSSGWAACSQLEPAGLGKVSIPATEADRCQAAAVEQRLLCDGSC